jgi:hypothetical protein
MDHRVADPAPVIILRALVAAVPIGIVVFLLVAGTAKLVAPSADVGSSAALVGWLAVGGAAAVLTWRWQQPR